jgi:hypothetical protein
LKNGLKEPKPAKTPNLTKVAITGIRLMATPN